jgi:hypothetical protein
LKLVEQLLHAVLEGSALDAQPQLRNAQIQ